MFYFQYSYNGEAVIIPVILRECAWHSLPFGSILAATVNGKAITKFTSLDEGFVQVVDAVSRVVDDIRAKKPQQNMQNSSLFPAFSPSQVINTVRSSNLSLPKRFSDLDRDRTRREGFEYISRYFENSLSELKSRNTEVAYDFQLEADAFSCTIYIHGRQVGRCGIWRNGNRSYGMGDIFYSQDGITRNSYNESFTVTDNGQILGFQASMSGFSDIRRESLLTNQGMADYLWDMFFTPIKQRAR